jgi:hypothetical protein
MYRNRVNEEITEPRVYLCDSTGQLTLISTAEALEHARMQHADLVCEYADLPERRASPPVCLLVSLVEPLRWERSNGKVGLPVEPEIDSDLWFETADCAGRHYLLGNPHTFPGRLYAWCPTKKVHHCVSKSEIEQCSRETTYFLRGYLSGQEPEGPVTEEGDKLPPDNPNFQVWRDAVELFGETGHWNERFRTCSSCGARLLPSNPTETCRYGHDEPAPRDGPNGDRAIPIGQRRRA